MLRNDAPPQFREFIRNHGNLPIKTITICKTPIQKAIDTIINLISFGTWNSAKTEYNFDTMFHLFMVLELAGDLTVRLEKNQVLTIQAVPNFKPTPETKSQPINYEYRILYDNAPRLTIKMLMDNAVAKYGAERIYLYSGVSNNCQRFISDLLIASKVLKPTSEFETLKQGNYNHTIYTGTIGRSNPDDVIYEFINQNVGELFNKMPQFVGIGSQTITDAAALFDRVLYGRGRINIR